LDSPSFDRARADRLARHISALTYPTFYCIPVLIIISAALLPWPDWAAVAAVCIFFATVVPVSIVLAFTSRTHRGQLDIHEREARLFPLLAIIPSYAMGYASLYAMSAPAAIQCLMLCYTINTAFVLAVSLFWKISIHAVGVSGPAVAMTYVFGSIGIVLMLMIPMVMWSRVHLKKHTVAQVIAGASSALTITTLVFLVMT